MHIQKVWAHKLGMSLRLTSKHFVCGRTSYPRPLTPNMSDPFRENNLSIGQKNFATDKFRTS